MKQINSQYKMEVIKIIFFTVITSVVAESNMEKNVEISDEEMVNEVLEKRGLTKAVIAKILDNIACKDELQEIIKNQEKEILDLKNKMKVLNTEKEQRIAALEKKNSEMEVTIQELMKNINVNEMVLPTNVASPNIENDNHVTAEVNNIALPENEVSENIIYNHTRFQSRALPVTGTAFSAYIGNAHIRTHLAAGHVLKCDQVIFNDGNHYNAFTGIFTVPRTAVYMFSFTFATAFQNKWLWVKLVVNNRMIVQSGTDAQYDDHVVNGGNTAILRLTQGESVWLEVEKCAPDAEVWMVDHTTTFSGVLLYG